MERELAMEIVRVTEFAALKSAYWMGRGDKMEADRAATEAMRKMFDTVTMDGIVVIGEGEMDEAPMLYIGERLGTGVTPAVDIAVDPLEGTEVVASGQASAITVVALAPRGQLLHAPDMYMEKIAVGPKASGKVHLEQSITENLKAVAIAEGKDISQVVAVVLDRPRHQVIIDEIRSAGARIKLIPSGDVAAAINTALPESGIDILFGSGGAPEGVLAACALKCLGGDIMGRLLPETEEQRQRCIEMGILDTERVLTLDNMVHGDDAIFSATGVTDGDFVHGVRFLSNSRARTQSIVMRAKTGTVRVIDAMHNLERKVGWMD